MVCIFAWQHPLSWRKSQFKAFSLLSEDGELMLKCQWRQKNKRPVAGKVADDSGEGRLWIVELISLRRNWEMMLSTSKGENNLLSWIFAVHILCRVEMWKQANYCLSFTLLVRNKRGKEANQCFLYLLTMKTYVSFLRGLWVRIILSKVAIRSIWKALKISVSESKPARMKRDSIRDGWDWRLNNRKHSPISSHE